MQVQTLPCQCNHYDNSQSWSDGPGKCSAIITDQYKRICVALIRIIIFCACAVCASLWIATTQLQGKLNWANNTNYKNHTFIQLFCYCGHNRVLRKHCVCFAYAAETSNFKREFDDDGKCCAATDSTDDKNVRDIRAAQTACAISHQALP